MSCREEDDSPPFTEKSQILVWFAINFPRNREVKGNILGTVKLVDTKLHDKHIGSQTGLSFLNKLTLFAHFDLSSRNHSNYHSEAEATQIWVKMLCIWLCCELCSFKIQAKSKFYLKHVLFSFQGCCRNTQLHHAPSSASLLPGKLLQQEANSAPKPRDGGKY